MKLNKYMLLAATALSVVFTGCKKEEPFDTQSQDDYPRILYPYESTTGTYDYELANPETPLHDSIIVSPSAYTTVRWYLDGQMVCEGLKIDTCVLAGNYHITIAASTEKHTTSREGSVIVNPYAQDPYSAEPEGGRHYAPAQEVQMDGVNLSLVTDVQFCENLFPGVGTYYHAEPTYKEDGLVKVTVPAMTDGTYFVRFLDAEGKVYGANKAYIHNGAVALVVPNEITMGKDYTISGINLAGVTKVIVAGQELEPKSVSATAVTFTVPELEKEGEYPLSLATAEGRVQIMLADGTYADQTVVKVIAKALITIANGPIYVGCQGDPNWTAKQIDGDFDWSTVSAGQVIFVKAHRDAATEDYNNFQIMTPDWSFRYPSADENLEFGDGVDEKIFEITTTAEMLAAFVEKGLGTAGHGTVIDRIYMEASEETVLWTGPVNIDWDADLVKVTKDEMAGVPVGKTILVYWTEDTAPGYHAFRITSPWWGDDYSLDDNYVGRTDEFPIANPFEFTWDARCQAMIEERGAMSVLGAGYTIDKITWK